MAKVKITNGFPNIGGKGSLLTGILIKGNIKEGDNFLLNNGVKIPIIGIEFQLKEQTGFNNVSFAIEFSRDHEVIWHKLYGETFEIENT